MRKIHKRKPIALRDAGQVLAVKLPPTGNRPSGRPRVARGISRGGLRLCRLVVAHGLEHVLQPVKYGWRIRQATSATFRHCPPDRPAIT